jgi:hypothetical protein
VLIDQNRNVLFGTCYNAIFLEEGMIAEENMIMARQGELKRLHVMEKVLEGIVKHVEAADISLFSSCVEVCFLLGFAFFIASKSLALIGGLVRDRFMLLAISFSFAV